MITIKNLFVEKYKALYPEFHDNQQPTDEHIDSIQDFIFLKQGKRFTDNKNSMRKNSKCLTYSKIKELLTYGDPLLTELNLSSRILLWVLVGTTQTSSILLR